jgi:SagB-type dehydrogenase family enzyme
MGERAELLIRGVDFIERSTISERVSVRRPRILTDIVLAPLEDGVVIDGLAHQEMIRGPVAQTILPDLIKLLDGTRTVEDLVTNFPGVPEEYLHTALSLLTDWGILQWDRERANQDEVNLETLAFLRRCIASAGLRSSALEAYARIRNANLILGAASDSCDLAGRLMSLLMRIGFQSVTAAHQVQRWPEGTLFIALSPHDFARCEGLKSRSGEKFSWLRTVIDEQAGYADVGPLFRADEGSCYRCFRGHHGEVGQLEKPVSPLTSHFWASILATEITYFVALPELGITGRDFKRFDIQSWRCHKLTYLRLPGCSQCWEGAPVLLAGGPATRQQMTDTALVYEQYVGLEARNGLEPSPAEQFAATNLTQAFKKLPDCEQIPLSSCNWKLSLGALQALGRWPRSYPPRGGPLRLDQLAALLALTAGVKEISSDGAKRWAATAGNLGSVELFVAARKVEGLKQGIYFYQAAEHTLAAFRKRGALGVPELMTRALGGQRKDLPDALIFLTGAFHRVARKYGSFAYRLINLDAGVALSQFHLVARSMDLWSQAAAAWADDLIHAQLDLRRGEHVTAVLLISGKTPRVQWWHGLGARARCEPEKPRSWKPVTAYRNLTAQEVTELLFHESRIYEAELNSDKRKIRPELLNKRLHGSALFSSPKRVREGLSVAHVLSGRNSSSALQ